MKKIIPHLWFDTQAGQAADFYTSLFPGSAVTNRTVLHDTPSGDTESIAFNLSGHPFMAISAGPLFKFTPAVSFTVNFDPSRDRNAQENLRTLWAALSQNGKILMPLQAYPFSKLYGWVADKYGLSWQLILTDPKGEERPFIIPSLLYVGQKAGKAEEAINHYLQVFRKKDPKDTKSGALYRYGKDQAPDREGSVMFADFMLAGNWFSAMDSAQKHEFDFSEAISFMVECDTQEEIDYYWKSMSAVPESEQCGWLKDKYGVSWQITPSLMNEMMAKGTEEQIRRVTQAFLPMKKLDIQTIKNAYENKGS